MNMFNRISAVAAYAGAVVAAMITTPLAADQQKWASQYAHWNFPDDPGEVWNIDQQVWLPIAANSSFWPVQWGFTGLDYGGYMGLQQGASEATQNVRFSIWKAVDAEGSACRTFDGEGVGYTCVLTMKIDPGKFYRTRLWRLDAEGDGQWWGGWLIEEDPAGNLTEHYIGRIKAPAEAKSIKADSISNFVEYFGSTVPKCKDVPMSVMGFTPPAVNYHGKGSGVYGGYSQFANSTKATGNTCTDGKQDTGAMITYKRYDYGFADGVMMFLGGSLADHVLNAAQHPTPPDMPDS